MADREVKLIYRIDDAGTLSVLDSAGRKLRELDVTAANTATATTGGFTRMQASVVTLNQVLGVAQTAFSAVKQVVDGVNASIGRVDGYGELAKSIGLSVTELTELRVAAQQGGVELGELGRSVSILQREIVKAAGGGGKATLFAQLGVSGQELREVRDGIRSTTSVMGDLGVAFEGLSKAQQVAFSRELFGRGGGRILNVLTSDMREQISVARELGAVISDDMASAADEAANALDALEIATQATQEAIGLALAPVVTDVANAMTQWATANREVVASNVSGWATDLRDTLAGDVLPFLKTTYQEIQAIGKAIDFVRNAKVSLGSGGVSVGQDFTASSGFIPGPDDVTEQVRQAAARAAAARGTLGGGGTSLPGGGSGGGRGGGRTTSAAKVDQPKELAADVRQATDAFVEMQIEVEQSRSAVLDLGGVINTSLQRAVDGVLARDNFDFSDIIEGTQTAIVSEITGAFTASLIAKAGFDEELRVNFAEDLPSFMAMGAEKIVDIFSGAMSFITGSADTAGGSIASTFGRAFGAVGSQAANLNAGLSFSGGGISVGNVSGTAGNFSVENEFGQLFSGPSLESTAQAASGVSADSGSGGLSGLGGIGAAAATYGASVALDLAINGSGRVKDLFNNTNLLRKTLDRGDIANAFGGGGIIGGIGKLFTENVALDIIFGGSGATILKAFGALQAPTAGTQISIGLQRQIKKANLPEQVLYDDGERGVRSQFLNVTPTNLAQSELTAVGFGPNIPGLKQTTIETLGTYIPLPDGSTGSLVRRPDKVKALSEDLERRALASPGVEDFRTSEALAYGVVAAGRLRGGVSVANNLTNNLLLLGVSEREARRQTRVLAESQGITLSGGIEEAQRLYLQGVFKDDTATADVDEKQQQLFTTVKGLVELFEDDLPTGVDASALAMRNFTAEAGIDIAEFNEDLERAIEIFGALENALEGGLKTGIGDGIKASLNTANLIETGAPIDEVIRSVNRQRAAVTTALFDAIRDGLSTAITESVFDAIKDTEAWTALTETIAGAVTGGSLTSFPGLLTDLIDTSLPAIEAAAQAAQIVADLVSVTPTALLGRADSVRDQIKEVRFGELSPREQEDSLRTELREIRAQLANPKLSASRRSELLDRQSEIGFDLASSASRFAPGSQARKDLIDEGLAISEDAAAQLERFGLSQAESTRAVTDNTAATAANTAAVSANTAAMMQYGGTTVIYDKGGVGSATFNRLRDVSDAIASGALSPQARRQIKHISRER